MGEPFSAATRTSSRQSMDTVRPIFFSPQWLALVRSSIRARTTELTVMALSPCSYFVAQRRKVQAYLTAPTAGRTAAARDRVAAGAGGKAVVSVATPLCSRSATRRWKKAREDTAIRLPPRQSAAQHYGVVDPASGPAGTSRCFGSKVSLSGASWTMAGGWWRSGVPLRRVVPARGVHRDQSSDFKPRRWCASTTSAALRTMDQGRQASSEDDAAFLPSLPRQRGAAVAECHAYNLGNLWRAAGLPTRVRHLVVTACSSGW